MIHFERGIPIGERSESVAAIKRMKIGDSVVLKTEAERWLYYVNARRFGIKIVTRKLLDGKGWRVWRVRR